MAVFHHYSLFTIPYSLIVLFGRFFAVFPDMWSRKDICNYFAYIINLYVRELLNFEVKTVFFPQRWRQNIYVKIFTRIELNIIFLHIEKFYI